MKTPLMSFFIAAWLGCLSPAVFSQYAYQDAHRIKKYVTREVNGKVLFKVTPANAKELGEVFKSYGAFPETVVEKEIKEKIKELLKDNPFLTVDVGVEEGTLSKDLKRLSSGALPGSVKGFDITTYADGLARFLVKRMKEELTITFFDQFEEELEKQKDLQKLFPGTYTILKTAKTEIYSYQSFLPALREAFQDDLSELLSHGYDWTVASETDWPLLSLLQAKPELHNVFKIVFYIGRELEHGVHPGDILASITEQPEIQFDVIDPNLKPVLKISDLFSQSLRSNSAGRYWITPAEARAFSDLTFLKIYLGLIYQQCPNDLVLTINGTSKPFKDILSDLAPTVAELQASLQEFSTKTAQAEEAIQKLLKEDMDKKGSDYFRAASSIVDLSIAIVDSKLYPGTKPDKAKLEEIRFYTDHGAALCADIETRAYNSAVFEIYTLLSKAIPTRQETLSAFLKYGTFAASVATAQSSEEVADAIESVALPVGSASIKRKTKSNIALNAYIGLSGGTEYYGSTNEWKGIFGMTAPVGIAFSWGHYACCSDPSKSAGSSSIFISLIDVGAFSTFRINDDETEALPEVTLSNIFAPGLYYVYGIPKIPLSVGLGAQLGPQLRKITTTDATTSDDINVSIRAFIAVDIPLINFRTKPR